MENWEVELAKIFRDRDNKKSMDITAAVIIDPMPNMRIGLGEEIILDTEHLIIANRVHSLALRRGDQVILMPTSNEQVYYVIDKVGV
ncbi:DUF2577 domain-containing protein [Paenibacillus sp. ACRRX]|uniref:DUF2577 domain-containing protein n=1 Tax=Paenibacillus sp. ACRRX TaxID=2918206 RepID=UPI001EF73B71|nr:DUF2577 domain-containing protein [Paenibacillus sp. ACRRX]MCG7410569.1 DUF2577 domain-containing protein [Paenibacillus sp. ACRRX]